MFPEKTGHAATFGERFLGPSGDLEPMWIQVQILVGSLKDFEWISPRKGTPLFSCSCASDHLYVLWRNSLPLSWNPEQSGKSFHLVSSVFFCSCPYPDESLGLYHRTASPQNTAAITMFDCSDAMNEVRLSAGFPPNMLPLHIDRREKNWT